MRLLLLAVFAAAVSGILPYGLGQKLSVGVIGGGSLTDSFPTETVPSLSFANRYYSSSKDYIVGPTIELRLLPRWSVEMDGMYRKLHFTTAGLLPNGLLTSVSPSPVITWEFPILAKYRFALWKIKPFVELGPSFRTAGNLNGTDPSHVGFTSGAGVELHAGRLAVAPVLRYTRWEADNSFQGRRDSNPDQLELLAAFSVSPESHWRPLGRHFSVGFLAGVELTEDLRDQSVSFPGFMSSFHSTRSFLAGPTVEFELRKDLSVEADAVYHPLHSEGFTTINGVVGRAFQGGIATWELPLMAKYKFLSAPVRPFVEAGPSFRLPSGGVSNYGVTAGAGFQAHLRRLGIAPSVRFTHWTSNSVAGSTSAVANQVDLLVRFSL